jgi:hypothetical protein
MGETGVGKGGGKGGGKEGVPEGKGGSIRLCDPLLECCFVAVLFYSTA